MGSEERFMRASASQSDGRALVLGISWRSLAKITTLYPVNEINGRPFRPRSY